LVPNTDVTISTVDPKIQVVVEYHEVVDKETSFGVQEQYDENLTQGSIIVAQEGKNGMERITQNVKSINGNIVYVDPVGKEVIQSSIPKVIKIGTKYIPTVGSTASWGWPTDPGYTITSYYGYRLAVFGEGNFHSGIDIPGTGYGSPIYAANNGTIEVMKNLGNTSYGKYIMINHNNGFYTLYAHLSGFVSELSVGSTVSRGQQIGYLGSSGWSTGPHLHYEIRTCSKYSCTTNPLKYYR
jgi:murein DD-endopeptidase MepM/ murein hydrolase activator NlpD